MAAGMNGDLKELCESLITFLDGLSTRIMEARNPWLTDTEQARLIGSLFANISMTKIMAEMRLEELTGGRKDD